MDGFPLPGAGRAVVAVPAPGAGPGWWAGAPGVALAQDGTFVIGYRVRNGHDGNDQVVVAVSEDGERLQTAAVLDESYFGAMAVERPSLVRRADGGWRLYVCCATPESKHWWIGALDADNLAGLAAADVRRVFPGDELNAVKDPFVRLVDGQWHAWICCHLLDQPGEEDRMNTAYATSDDGLDWQWHGTVLEGRPGRWDARGARLTTVLPDGRGGLRRPAHRRGELVRAHGARAPHGPAGRSGARWGGAGRGRPLPGGAAAAGRRLPHLVRGPPARREPRAAHGAGAGMSDGNGFAAGAAFVDGRYVPVAEASIPILDWGFLRGDATYDVVHVWDGSFFRLEEHLDRFERSIARLFYSIPFDRDAIAETLHRCVALAGLRDAFVEMLVTRGIPRNRDPRTAENRFAVFAVPFVSILPPERRDAGLHLVITSIERIRAQSVDPTVKNYHWLDLVRGLYEAYDRGGETAVLVDAEGHVLEGPGFNVYAVSGGGAVTPGEGVLEGVTRGTAAELLARRNVRVAMRPLHGDELRSADEVFGTSTAGGVMPITTVDGAPVGSGAVGPVTARLIEDYWAAHRLPEWATPVRYELADATAASASPSAP